MIAKMFKTTFKGQEAYISDMQIPSEERLPSLHYYEIRHSDEDFYEPATVEIRVSVNFFGTLATKQPLEFADPKDPFISLSEEESEEFRRAVSEEPSIDLEAI